MLTRISHFRLCLALYAVIGIGASTSLGQSTVREFHNFLADWADLGALEQGQPVVKLLPTQDKKEVAVCGLVSLQVPAEAFLKSFRESMVRRSNPAILEIGSFGSEPILDDLQNLTFEDRDIDDLRECGVGNCKVKLSAAMIERLHREVDWESTDYKARAIQLLKSMLLEYVRDYLQRGDVALIRYYDKANEVRLSDEQQALAGSNSSYNFPGTLPQSENQLSEAGLRIVENKIVWSKIKYGLKPVIAINHIMIYIREQKSGPQVLIVSKQIYANHYFDSSLALTAFGSITDDSPKSYLFYENRSRLDGLTGAFGKMKRGIVEDKAVDSLKAILEKSKINLNASTLSPMDSATDHDVGPGLSRWLAGTIRLFLCLLLLTGFVLLLAVSNYNWKANTSAGARQ